MITSSWRLRNFGRGFFGPIRTSDENLRAFHLAIVLRSTPYRLARTVFFSSLAWIASQRLGWSLQSRAFVGNCLAIQPFFLVLDFAGCSTASLAGPVRNGPRACLEPPSGKASRLSRMGEEFMREMFKPYGLAPDVRVHRTPQHVQFIQQPIKAGITTAYRRRRCQEYFAANVFLGSKNGRFLRFGKL